MISNKACLALLLTALVTLTGCRTSRGRYKNDTLYIGGFQRNAQAQNRAPHDDVSYWDGDSAAGSPSVRVDLGDQKAFFYKGGQLVGVSTISTGREGFNTPTGSFHVQQKDRDHLSSLYGDYIDARSGEIIKQNIERGKDPMPKGAKFDGARMPYFMRISGGVGMHEGFLPGYPASHGCIRMPGFMAEKFFENVNVGTPVSVVH